MPFDKSTARSLQFAKHRVMAPMACGRATPRHMRHALVATFRVPGAKRCTGCPALAA